MQRSVKNFRRALFDRLFNPQEISSLREHLGDVRRFGPPPNVDYDYEITTFPHYEKLLPNGSNEESMLSRDIELISPVLQGPFIFPNNFVLSGPWRGEYKNYIFETVGIKKIVKESDRILDIGCNAGFDTFYLSTLNPAEIIGIDPSPFFYQALMFWTHYYCPNVRFVNCGWQALTPQAFGQFDLINCQGILYHEPSPTLLLQRIFEMLVPSGMLLLETHVTMKNEMSALFVEGDFWGDNNWWWITDADTTCALLRSLGFVDANVHHACAVPSKNPEDELRTVEGVPVGGRATITAVKPQGEGRFKSL